LMTILKSRAVAIFLMLLSSSVLLLNGCGREEAKSEGCPSGSFVANSTDTITGPVDGSFTISSSFDNLFTGGRQNFAPLAYTILDKSGVPRNKVCVTFYTGGSFTNGVWYLDNSYSTVVNGTGALNSVVAVTDDNGRITLFWSTGLLPAANPVVVDSSVTPNTYTAGADQTGTTFVQAYSGTLSTQFVESWTIKGQTGPT
jgi:hypothetical protein